MPRPGAGLRVVIRKWKGGEALTIVGTIAGQRIRRRAQSNRRALAQEEAAHIEAELLRTEWHGERRGARPFAQAVTSYIDSAPRSAGDQDRLNRILKTLGDVSLQQIDQDAINHLIKHMLRPDAKSATILRGVITPVRAVMLHAAKRGWCDRPNFEIPKQRQGRTNYLLPHEFERLLAAGAPHFKPLLIFLVTTGARLSEAIELEWRDVDLQGARVIFWRTKTGQRRDATLPPRTVAALGGLGAREGAVFRWQTTPDKTGKVKALRSYADRGRQEGGHIKRAWAGALRRAGLSDLTPHDLRHTWASWHYALHRDLLALKVAGGWSSVTLVERYAHLLPAGQEAAIAAVMGGLWHNSATNFVSQATSA